ncbi:unnamed protein product, partial [Vitis vinifera]
MISRYNLSNKQEFCAGEWEEGCKSGSLNEIRCRERRKKRRCQSIIFLPMTFIRRYTALTFPDYLPTLRSFDTTSSISTLLKACTTTSTLEQVHARIIRKGLHQDHFIISQFLTLCNSLSNFSYTTSVFNGVSSPSTVLWNTYIKGYSENYSVSLTVSLFIRMKRSDAVPDKFTYPSLIKACSKVCGVKEGVAFHGSAVRCGVGGDVFVMTSLIDLYGKCGEILCARKVFDEMGERNVVSWTAMIAGYASFSDLVEARKLFDEMPEKNAVSWNAIISGYVKCGDLRSARKMFDEMPHRNRDVVAWSALISGNVKPDEFIMVSLMSACSQMGSLELAKWVDDYVRKSSIDVHRAHVIAALIDMNAKCGSMDRATKLFEEMPKRDLISYCSMMQGLSIHGCGPQAVSLFSRMLNEGLTPDDVAFTVILTACSRAGLVDEGCYYFESMKTDYSIVPSPDHYACMVDLLGRAGRLKEAYELLKSMPVEPHAGAWGALLGACKLHCDIELGEVVADQLFELEPQNAGNYVLLSNIYAAAEQWLDVSLLRNKMRERGIRKIPGCSWI